jgi:hypothetical protein
VVAATEGVAARDEGAATNVVAVADVAAGVGVVAVRSSLSEYDMPELRRGSVVAVGV